MHLTATATVTYQDHQGQDGATLCCAMLCCAVSCAALPCRLCCERMKALDAICVYRFRHPPFTFLDALLSLKTLCLVTTSQLLRLHMTVMPAATRLTCCAPCISSSPWCAPSRTAQSCRVLLLHHLPLHNQQRAERPGGHDLILLASKIHSSTPPPPANNLHLTIHHAPTPTT